MAIYHLCIKIISRGKGKSAVAASAYRSGEKIKNEYDGIVHDFTRKGGIAHTEILLPQNAPQEFLDRGTLWNSVEKIEKSKNSQLAREIEVALPKELDREKQIELVRQYVKENFVKVGMCADIALHDKNDGNPHCHILLTMRPLNEDTTWGAKSKKEYILDENGEKVKLKNGNYKTRKINITDWNEQDKAEEWRKAWADITNKYLEENSIQDKVDHRSYQRQRIEQIPSIHLGVSANQMEKKGIATERGNHNRKIIAFNLEFKKLKEELSKLTSWIGSLVGKLQSKYDEYKQEKKDELENKAELFNLYEYISIYHDLQGEKARALKPYASNKKMAADLRRFSKAIYYLRDNKLQTIADLQEKIGTLQAENKNINQEVKVKSKRIENLNKCFTYADIIKDNKATYEEWNNKTLFKDSFYNSHKEEIDKYKRARKMIEQFTGSSAIKSKDWQKEMKTLEDEITKLNKHSQAIKEEYENINHIKYAVKIVNDDYGIDLSIEIDKAIKRGEKPSVIGQIKKYQEQQEKYEKKKEKTKDYYRNEER